MKYSSRGDLLIAAGESIKMQEKAGIEPVFKTESRVELDMRLCSFYVSYDYEFPLAVIEGKPVFVGDELYTATTGKQKVVEYNGYTIKFSDGGYEIPDKCSWLPPKPKTVMVELTVEDAEAVILSNLSTRIAIACLKALEKLK